MVEKTSWVDIWIICGALTSLNWPNLTPVQVNIPKIQNGNLFKLSERNNHTILAIILRLYTKTKCTYLVEAPSFKTIMRCTHLTYTNIIGLSSSTDIQHIQKTFHKVETTQHVLSIRNQWYCSAVSKTTEKDAMKPISFTLEITDGKKLLLLAKSCQIQEQVTQL